jgi:hypothetical protein
MPGGALKLQYPELFAIASRKSLLKELQDRNWLRSLFRLSTAAELAQLVKLWTALREVVLQPRADAISWRWTASGVYSTASAYRCQFAGAYPPFRTAKVWNTHAEPKCRFFAWLALHGKVLTADNLAIRGWPHDPICKLCRIHPETVQHLLLDCSFAKSARDKIFGWNGTIGVPPPVLGHGLNSWWDGMVTTLQSGKRREANGAFIYTIWGIWKERNRRVFRNESLMPDIVAHIIWEDIAQRAFAHSQDPGDLAVVF